jgi:hypothetical protein
MKYNEMFTDPIWMPEIVRKSLTFDTSTAPNSSRGVFFTDRQ